MKAILLVGGFGTRLRPLTNTVAKPMVPLVNRPAIEYTIDLLKRHGIYHVIFSSFYLPDAIEAYFGDGEKFGVKIEYCLEDRPLGTAGAIKNCERLLDDESFLIFNGDVLTDLNLTEMLAQHRSKGALATISLGKVIDPTQYGMIELVNGGRVKSWIEKPSWDQATSRWVNLGASIFEPEFLSYIPANETVSIERETYPMLIGDDKPIYGFQSPAYWLDLGTPEKYLRGQRNLLIGVVPTEIAGEQISPNLWVGENTVIEDGAVIKGPVALGKNVRVSRDAVIIGPTAIGDDVQIGREAFVEECAIWDQVVLEDRASLTGAIVGYGAQLKADATLKDGCIVENGFTVTAEQVHVEGTILSHPKPEDAA